MSYKRGDVVLVSFPFSDLKGVKARPALIVQSNSIHTGLQNLILALITSNMVRSGPAFRVTVRKNDAKFPKAHLNADSVIMADHLVTLYIQLIERKIGEITDMTLVDNALRLSLAL